MKVYICSIKINKALILERFGKSQSDFKWWTWSRRLRQGAALASQHFDLPLGPIEIPSILHESTAPLKQGAHATAQRRNVSEYDTGKP